jgi:lipopolysaccharide transport system permease protein
VIHYFKTLVQYRDLLYFLWLRDVKAKYKQTVLGVAWAVLQPVMLMFVFTVVFSYFARLPSDGAPYALFSYCALLPWQFFAGVLSRGAGGLLSNQVLVKKVYFPREIILFAVVASAAVDFVISAAVFGGLLWFYEVPVTLHTLWIIPVLMMQVLFVLGLILVLSPLNVFYRDIGIVIPMILQLWMYATPIIYPLSVVPARLHPYYALNPMAGIVEAYRSILLHHVSPESSYLMLAAVVSCVTFIAGLMYFKRVEFRLADVL